MENEINHLRMGFDNFLVLIDYFQNNKKHEIIIGNLLEMSAKEIIEKFKKELLILKPDFHLSYSDLQKCIKEAEEVEKKGKIYKLGVSK